MDKMAIYEALKTGPLDKIKAIEALKGRDDIDDYFRQLSGEVVSIVKGTICCYGYTQIVSTEQRKKLAEKITEAIGDVIPSPWNVAWLFVISIIYNIVLEMLEEAAKIGEAYCKDVVCALPLVIQQ